MISRADFTAQLPLLLQLFAQSNDLAEAQIRVRNRECFLYCQKGSLCFTVCYHASYQEPVFNLKNYDSSSNPDSLEIPSDTRKNLSLDYHILLDREVWFYVHPCMSNDVVPASSIYLLSWGSIYGRLIGLNIDAQVFKDVCAESSSRFA